MLKRILVTFIFVLGAALLFWSSRSLQGIFFETVASVQEYTHEGTVPVATLFIVLAALSAMLSPFSSIPLVPVAIMVWGKSLTVVFLLSGWFIGGVLTYIVGYFVGYPLVRQFSSFEKIRYYREKISEKTEFLLVLLFRLSMPAEIPGYVLGIARYHFGKYLLATLIAEAPFVIIVTYASEALVVNNVKMFIALVAVICIAIASLFYFFTKKLKLKDEPHG